MDLAAASAAGLPAQTAGLLAVAPVAPAAWQRIDDWLAPKGYVKLLVIPGRRDGIYPHGRGDHREAGFCTLHVDSPRGDLQQAAKALPEDEAVLKNGERQGERGHPPGGALAPAASPQPLQQGV